jgi:hypothetical protein
MSRTADNTRDLWKNIWSTPVTNKVKVFAWQVAADNLATK